MDKLNRFDRFEDKFPFVIARKATDSTVLANLKLLQEKLKDI